MKFQMSALFLLSSSLVWAGTLTGTVHFKGHAPKPEVIRMTADAVCASETKTSPVKKQDLEVNDKGTIPNVFVVVKDFKGTPPPVPAEPILFDQTKCHYVPHVFGIRVGQGLKIVNSDPTLHNVHSITKTNPSFNVGMPTKGMMVEKKFTKPEIMVRIKCDVHGWMNAYAGVVDHPFFAVTDEAGNFSIANLPAGEYTVEAWQEKLGTKTEKVKVTDAGGKVDFTFGSGT